MSVYVDFQAAVLSSSESKPAVTAEQAAAKSSQEQQTAACSEQPSTGKSQDSAKQHETSVANQELVNSPSAACSPDQAMTGGKSQTEDVIDSDRQVITNNTHQITTSGPSIAQQATPDCICQNASSAAGQTAFAVDER